MALSGVIDAAATGSRTFRIIAVAIVSAVMLHPSIGASQQAANEDRADVVELTSERLEHALCLMKGWSYHPGDDPAWADPAFDDSSWPLVRPDLRDLEAIPGGWPGIGWFRRRVMLDPAVENTTVGVWTIQVGASELYIDGELAVQLGTVSADPKKERAVSPQTPDSVALRPGEVHVFAVRFSNARDNGHVGGFRGFEMWVGDIGRMVTWVMNLTRTYWGVSAAAAGVFVAFGLLHLLLFLSRPELRENLYFALFNATLVLVLVSELWVNSQSEISKFHLGFNVEMTCLFAMVVSALLIERRVE